MSRATSNLICFMFSFTFTVLSAQMVDPANASDIVFPSGPQDLANFTAGDMDTTAQISIPADAVSIISGGSDGASEKLHFVLHVDLLGEQFLLFYALQ